MHPWPRFLFWYLTLLSLVAAGLLVLLCAFVYAIPSLPFVDLAMLTAVPLWTYFICFCASIILCVVCARAHQIGFWRGILGWFLGFALLFVMIYVPLVVSGLDIMVLMLTCSTWSYLPFPSR